MYRKTFDVTFVLILLGILRVADTKGDPAASRQEPATQLCDLHMWYMDRVADGAFNKELTAEQLKVKKRIEVLIARTRGTPQSGRVACSVLTVFDTILLPGGSGGGVVGHKENGPDERAARESSGTEHLKVGVDENKEKERKDDDHGDVETVRRELSSSSDEGTTAPAKSVSLETKDREHGNYKKGDDGQTSTEDNRKSETSKEDHRSEESRATTAKMKEVVDETELTEHIHQAQTGQPSVGNEGENEKKESKKSAKTTSEDNHAVKSQSVTASASDNQYTEGLPILTTGSDDSLTYTTQSGQMDSKRSIEPTDLMIGKDKNSEQPQNSTDDMKEGEKNDESSHLTPNGHSETASRVSDSVHQGQRDISKTGKKAGRRRRRRKKKRVHPFAAAPMSCKTSVSYSRWTDYMLNPFLPPLDTYKSCTQTSQDVLPKGAYRASSRPKRQRKNRRRRWSLANHYFHIMDGHEKKKPRTEPGRMSLAKVIRISCQRPNKCYRLCFYATERLQCLQHYDTHSGNFTEQNTLQEAKNNESKETEIIDNIWAADETEIEAGDDPQMKDIKSTDCADVACVEESEKKAALKNAEDKISSHTTEEKAPPYDSDKTENNRMKERTDKEKDHDSNQQDKENKPYNSDSKAEGLSEKELLKIETTFQQKTSEQATKIQNLEILVMKLENNILNQKLNDQSGSSHLTFLENQILRIENELLKLNQSYASLKAENEILKARQKKHLALEHKSNQRENRLALPSNSSDYFKLVTVQQEKIFFLSELLKNQSEAVHKLQSRSDKLEEQNQMLYQIVMNQTALISSVMHKLQQVSEQSIKNRQETNQLKVAMKMESVSTSLLDKLENILHTVPNTAGNQPAVKDAAQRAQSQTPKAASSHNILTILQNMPHYVSKVQDFNCQSSKKVRLCIHFTLILSPCPPFRLLAWNKCPYLFGEIGFPAGDRGMQVPKNNRNILTKNLGVSSESLNTDTRLLDSEKAIASAQADNSLHHHIKDELMDKKRKSVGSETPDSVNIPIVKSTSTEAQSAMDTAHDDRNKGPIVPQLDPGPVEVMDSQIHDTNKKPEEENKSQHAGNTRRSGSQDARSRNQHEGEEHKKAAKPTKPCSGPWDEKAKILDKAEAATVMEEERKAMKLQQQRQEAEALKMRIKEANNRTLLYRSSDDRKPKDCYDLYQRAQGQAKNGAYKIFVKGLNLFVSVFCDMKAGGWTVLMKREDGSLDFYRTWADYTEGFGTPFSEHYLGNEVIHYLTNQAYYSLQVDLKDWKGDTRQATYSHFWLDDEQHLFRLHVIGYSGTAGDGLSKHDGMNFSTMDQDNDLLAENQMGGSCARRFHGAGWYYKCYMSNLMGRHYEQGTVADKQFDGIAWKPWTGPSYSLKEVMLKIRSPGAGAGVG